MYCMVVVVAGLAKLGLGEGGGSGKKNSTETGN